VTVDEESGDAHRITGIGASPGPSPSTSSPSPTSPSPTPTQSSASPSPTATTPPPPVAYSSNTTLKVDGNKFSGKVKSGTGRCRSGRSILLKKEKPGKDKTVGKDRTNRRGAYSIKERDPNGTYYAFARAKGFTDRFGRPVTCEGDKSPEREV
jgi:hypothetical protein